ncbi:MAG: NAD kinase [Roseibium sp.]
MKFACLISGSDKSLAAQKTLAAKYAFVAPEEADVILTLGGDGFLLHTVHEVRGMKKPIYGMNCGTVGFLLNEYDPEDVEERIRNAIEIVLPPLRIDATTDEGEKCSLLAFNEMSIVRYSNQSLNLKVKIDGREQLSKYVGDGLLLATPAGSTAYNLAVRGPILPLTCNVLALTPVSPFRPRRWHGAVVPNTTELDIEVLDSSKRPAGASGDFYEIRNAVHIRAHLEPESAATVLFDKHQTLDDRIASEQFYDG